MIVWHAAWKRTGPILTAPQYAQGRVVVSVSMSRSRDGLETQFPNVSVSSRSRGNMGRFRSRSRLGLKIKCLGLVSVSYHRVSFTSHYSQLFASLQNCTYIVLNAGHLYCLLIHKSKRLTVCTTENVGRQQSILQHVTLMPFIYQVCHSIGPCVKMVVVFIKYGVKVNGQYYWDILLIPHYLDKC